MSKSLRTAKRISDLPKPYHVAAMAEINSQTARGAAIAAGAFLDLWLRLAIEARIVPDTELQGLLFEHRGPLQDFASRIQMAYGLKVCGWRAYADLCIIKDVRNVFAHSAESFDFDREDIATRCASLWFPSHIRYGSRGMPVTPRDTFIRGVELLADGLAEDTSQRPAHMKGPAFLFFGPPKPSPPQLPTSPKKRQRRSSPGYQAKS
jgi:hypothetical protein